MFALRVEAKVNTVGSSSSYCKGHACTKHFPDQGRSFGFCFPQTNQVQKGTWICLFVVSS